MPLALLPRPRTRRPGPPPSPFSMRDEGTVKPVSDRVTEKPRPCQGASLTPVTLWQPFSFANVAPGAVDHWPGVTLRILDAGCGARLVIQAESGSVEIVR